MADIVGMLKERQEKSQLDTELFARKIGLSTGSTLYHYYNGRREIGVDAARKMAKRFIKNGDTEMVNALASFLLQVDFPLK